MSLILKKKYFRPEYSPIYSDMKFKEMSHDIVRGNLFQPLGLSVYGHRIPWIELEILGLEEGVMEEGVMEEGGIEEGVIRFLPP